MSRHLAVEPDLHPDLPGPLDGAVRPVPVDGPLLDADQARDLLRSMAAMTRVVFGVALQGPAGVPAATPQAPQVTQPAPVAPPASPAGPAAPRLAPAPDAVPAQPPAQPPARRPEPPVAALAPVPAPPGPAPLPLPAEDREPAAPRSHGQNLGLLQEIAFLDD